MVDFKAKKTVIEVCLMHYHFVLNFLHMIFYHFVEDAKDSSNRKLDGQNHDEHLKN